MKHTMDILKTYGATIQSVLEGSLTVVKFGLIYKVKWTTVGPATNLSITVPSDETKTLIMTTVNEELSIRTHFVRYRLIKQRHNTWDIEAALILTMSVLTNGVGNDLKAATTKTNTIGPYGDLPLYTVRL